MVSETPLAVFPYDTAIEIIETYGLDCVLTILKKYRNRVVTFRQVLRGDHAVVPTEDGGFAEEVWDLDTPSVEPWLILRPLPKKRVLVDVLFRATGETRLPKKGEWLLAGNIFEFATADFCRDEYPIYIRIETQREVEVDE